MAGKDSRRSSDGGAGPSTGDGGATVKPDPEKAIRFKEEGNKCFGRGEWGAAEEWYVRAIQADPTNPALHTNHSLTLLKLSLHPSAILAAKQALVLQHDSFKAYHLIAQAQIALEEYDNAVRNAEKAHELCVDEIRREGKGMGSLGAITEVVLKGWRGMWLVGEGARQKEREERQKLGEEMIEMIKRESGGDEEEVERKIQEVRRMFGLSEEEGEEKAKRKVPDWVVDDISFNPMVDPVMTKTGNSYERASIMKHLERSQTDPLTREPLTIRDLRPNLALKAACREFLMENGWAVDE